MTKSSQMNGENCLRKHKFKCKTKGLKFVDCFRGADSEGQVTHLHHLETLTSDHFIMSNNKILHKQN